MTAHVSRHDAVLAVLALVGATVFLLEVGRLWPLVPGNLRQDARRMQERASVLAPLMGTDVRRYRVDARLRVDDPALTWVETAFGRERTLAAIRDGVPLVWERVTFKQPGNPDAVTVGFLTDGQVLGWERVLQEDAAGREVSALDAGVVAVTCAERLHVDLSAYRVVERSWKKHPNRIDHVIAYERERSTDEADPPLRERFEVTIAGTQAIKAWRSVVLPGSAERAQRAHSAPVHGLEALGFLLLTAGGVAAFVISVRSLVTGGLRLGPSAGLVVMVGLLLAVTHALQRPVLFERWDPLGPWWLSVAKDLTYDLIDDVPVLLMLLFFLLAGHALDRMPRRLLPPAHRSASLWAFARGAWSDPSVQAASVRGFLIGAVCGGVLTAGVLVAMTLPGARIALQPRGFFFFSLNSVCPEVTTLCFFAHIALVEELGYRFFAGSWIERWSGRQWLAIAIPAAVYGLCHTAFDFLPPADPFWARPLILGMVGCVWGWAFFRYDALTVVLSHLTCDLFIFNWPSLAGGGGSMVAAVVVLSVPLWPALVGMVRRRTPAPSG